MEYHKKDGFITKNVRGGSLVQASTCLRNKRENAPQINNNLNEAIHFSILFMNDKLQIFLVHIHHTYVQIDDIILTEPALYK